jgi:hypothetical protein
MAIRGQRFSTNDDQNMTTRPAAYIAPVDRQAMDRFKPAFYLFVAAGFFALSVISTVSQVGIILGIGGVQLVSWQMIAAGLAVAAVISIGEFMTSEGWLYFAFLIPDVALTVWFMWEPLLRWSTAAGAGILGAGLAGMAIGIISAWLPERVVIGTRRRNRAR